MLAIQPMLVTPDVKIAKEPGITIIAHQMRPESSGSIHIKTRTRAAAGDPFNFLARASTASACSRHAHHAPHDEAPALAGLEPEEFAPGRKAQSDDELLDFVHAHRRDDLSSGRHCRWASIRWRWSTTAARARHRGSARRRCLDHADAHLGQHQLRRAS
jgi:hypothetical protein